MDSATAVDSAIAVDNATTIGSRQCHSSRQCNTVVYFSVCVGEVFVLDDGSEVDLDLGNYERFLDLTLRRDNNITTGKIYHQVIQCERRGEYLGKTVQGE